LNKNTLQKLGITFISKEKKLAFRKYEEFIFNFLLETLIELDFFPLPKYIETNYSISPKFSKKRGIRTSRIPIENLRDWLSPSIVLEHRSVGSLLSIYYDGYPLIRTKLRPDISIVSGEIRTEVRSLSKIKTIVDVFRKLRSKDQFERVQSFSPIVDDFGPEPIGEGVISPLLIVDPTLRKSGRILKKQIESYFKTFRPKSIIIFSESTLSFLQTIQPDSLFIFDDFDNEKGDFKDKSHAFKFLLRRLLKPLLNNQKSD